MSGKRALGAFAMAAPIVFLVLVVIGGFLWDGYSHISQKVSELGGDGAETPLLQGANFVVIGLAAIGLAWALRSALGGALLGPALIALFGLSAGVLNAVFPCDINCDGQTTVGLLHNVTGVVGFLSAITGMWVLSRVFAGRAEWGGHAAISRAASILCALGLVAFIVTQVAEFESIDGLVQRSFVIVLLAWVSMTGWRVYRLSEPLPAGTGVRSRSAATSD